MAKKTKVEEGVFVSTEGTGAVEGTALNWELTGSAVIDDMPDDLRLKRSLYDCWCQVDPEIREDNPVWRFAYCEDHVSFVFRDGRKVTISL